MLMGPAYEHMLMDRAHGHMLMGVAHAGHASNVHVFLFAILVRHEQSRTSRLRSDCGITS